MTVIETEVGNIDIADRPAVTLTSGNDAWNTWRKANGRKTAVTLEKALHGKTISSVWFGVDAPLTTEQWSALTGVIIQGYGQLVQEGLLPPNLFSTVETPLDIVIPEVPEEFNTEGEKEFHVRPVVRLEATLGFTRDWVNQESEPPEAEELAAQLRNKINGTV